VLPDSLAGKGEGERRERGKGVGKGSRERMGGFLLFTLSLATPSHVNE